MRRWTSDDGRWTIEASIDHPPLSIDPMTAAAGESDLRADAIAIWRAGVAAVDSALLVRNVVQRSGDALTICGHSLDLRGIGRICVVGGGKAGAGMAAGLEQALGSDLVSEKVAGWLNVPADCVAARQAIHLHPGRPAGVNEPTPEGVAGSDRMLQLVAELGADDVCLVLLSGGASALLPAPVDGVSLADKQAVTRLLSRGGATIQELNCVRKQLSRLKGGRLARACGAGILIGLIISDIIGDPLDVIGSGPTVPDSSTPAEALEILRRFDPQFAQTPPGIIEHLRRSADVLSETPVSPPTRRVFNHVVGNNQVALDAAARKAQQLGYELTGIESNVGGVAADVGRELAARCRNLAADGGGRRCFLSGGEPTVKVEHSQRPQKGGRNQELALAAVHEFWQTGMSGICLLSGGTDGEDGPTDAAGAIADDAVIHAARRLDLDPTEYLEDHNSYEFFERTGGLLITGPTHTNVMDVRVALINKRPGRSKRPGR